MGTNLDVVISATGLTKRFRRTNALDGLDLYVLPGEIHGFLGPNGAGKTTTIRVLLGLIRSSGGQATVLGMDPWSDAPMIHRRLAYVPGDIALWPNLTGGETIDLLMRMRGADPGNARSRRDELVERFQLNPTKLARAYSTGNRQKVALVAAFAVRPNLLLLDEPTSGLDPLMKHVFKDCLVEAVTEGSTALVSSHVLGEVEHLVDRITIIRDGRTVESGALADLQHLSRTTIHVRLREAVPDLRDMPGVRDVSVTGHELRCSVDPAALSELIAVLAGAGVEALTSSPPTLEDLFMDVYNTAPATVGRDRTRSAARDSGLAGQ